MRKAAGAVVEEAPALAPETPARTYSAGASACKFPYSGANGHGPGGASGHIDTSTGAPPLSREPTATSVPPPAPTATAEPPPVVEATAEPPVPTPVGFPLEQPESGGLPTWALVVIGVGAAALLLGGGGGTVCQSKEGSGIGPPVPPEAFG